MDGQNSVPDHLRCRRTDGRRWRCSRQALGNVSFCEIHQVQARRRQKKLPIPDSLKLIRGPKHRQSSDAVVLPPPSDQLQIIPRKRESEEGVIGDNVVKEGRRKRGRGRKAEEKEMVLFRPKTKKSANNGMPMMESLENAYSSLEVTPPPVEDSESSKKNDEGNDANCDADSDDDNIAMSEVNFFLGLEAPNSTEMTDVETSDTSKKRPSERKENPNVRTKRNAPQEVEFPVEEAQLIRNRRNYQLNAPLLAEDGTINQKNTTLAALHVEGTTINQKSIVLAPMPVRKKNINRKIVDSAVHSTLGVPPDDLRCRRNDGKQWRCKRQALENHCFCELHQIQQYRRQYKLGVPDELKLQRKPGGGSVVHPQIQEQKMARQRIKRIKEKGVNMKKDDSKRKRNKRIESLAVEVMMLILKKKMEKSEKDEERRRREGAVEIVKNLPNGVMRISSVASNGCSNNTTQQLKIKLGADQSSFFHWCFRSKNVEPTVGTIQKAPYVRKALGLVNRRKKTCHHCRSSNNSRTVRCSKCWRTFFCKTCLKKWYPKLSAEEAKQSCPICRGNCRCKVCLSKGAERANMRLQDVAVG